MIFDLCRAGQPRGRLRSTKIMETKPPHRSGAVIPRSHGEWTANAKHSSVRSDRSEAEEPRHGGVTTVEGGNIAAALR